jgi:hypothetical protein
MDANIYTIVKENKLDLNSPCPKKITVEMLVNSMDCEDLRSRSDLHKIKPELWDAYVKVNSHMFPASISNTKHVPLGRLIQKRKVKK